MLNTVLAWFSSIAIPKEMLKSVFRMVVRWYLPTIFLGFLLVYRMSWLPKKGGIIPKPCCVFPESNLVCWKKSTNDFPISSPPVPNLGWNSKCPGKPYQYPKQLSSLRGYCSIENSNRHQPFLRAQFAPTILNNIIDHWAS